MAAFWHSKTGIALRWIFYIPAGLLLLKLVEVFGVVFLTWLFRDVRGLIIVGFLLGGLSFIFFAGYCYFQAFKLVVRMCPKTNPGMAVFGGVFLLLEFANVVSAFRLDPWQSATRVALSAVVCSVIAFFTIVDAWHSKAKA